MSRAGLVGSLRNVVSGYVLVALLVGFGAAAAARHASADRAAWHPTYVQALEGAHGCWTGAAPAGTDLPGGVVWQRGGRAPEYVGSDRAVGVALRHVFNGARPALTVYAFCP